MYAPGGFQGIILSAFLFIFLYNLLMFFKKELKYNSLPN